MVEAGDAGFADAVDTKRLVLVDLWAPWCGPCRMVAPVLEKLSQEFADSLKVVKVNVDESPRVAQRYEARSIPMLLFMRDGQLVETVVGAQPEHVLRARIEAQVPLKRLGTVEECAAASMPFLDGTSTFVTGQFLAFDGGWSS